MQRLNRLPQRPAGAKPLALAIGVFDGMHVGHQAVLHAAARLARREGWLSAALSFNGPPEAVLGQPVPPRLGHPDDDAAQMQGLGLGLLLHVPFTKALGRLRAQEFIDRVLKRRLRCAAVVVGHGFRFGRGAEGDVALLRRSGLTVLEVAPLKRGGHLVSSTRLRHAVQSGHLREAAKLLGRPWRLRATVVKGRGLGSQIGVPTANLEGPQAVLPPHGVWAGKVRSLSAKGPGPWKAFAGNIGVRPTVEEQGKVSVELHLLGFKGGLRGKTLEAEFHRQLRREKKFPSLKALVAQIQRDLVKAKKTMQGKLAASR